MPGIRRKQVKVKKIPEGLSGITGKISKRKESRVRPRGWGGHPGKAVRKTGGAVKRKTGGAVKRKTGGTVRRKTGGRTSR